MARSKMASLRASRTSGAIPDVSYQRPKQLAPAPREAFATGCFPKKNMQHKGTLYIMKRCAFCNVGSRGDLQPLIALALALKAKGTWEVVLISEESGRALAESFALEFRAVAGDSTGIMFEEEYAEMLAKGKLMAMIKESERRKKTWYDQASKDWVETTKDVQMIVSGPFCYNETFCVAEKLGVPWIPLLYGPLYPTRDFPNPFVMESNWFSWLNLLSFNFLYWALWKQQAADVNAFRSQLGLEPLLCSRGLMSVIEEKELLVIGAFHEVFIPTLKVPADWPANFFFKNFPFTPKNSESCSPELQQFLLNNKGNVIYLGLGSMPAPRPRELLELAERIVRTLKVKAILCAGWSNVESSTDLQEDILVIKSCPHDLVFPQCQVILHHAGVGTSAATLRSGVPSVCLPVMLDQFYNAKQLTRLGVAPPSIAFQNVASSPDSVIEALRCCLESPMMAEQAKELCSRLEESDGATQSVEKVLDTYFPS
ncbi:unnamed protein product [Effrenium voratum]|nr:unnamed protein product [Effrenium voratum]